MESNHKFVLMNTLRVETFGKVSYGRLKKENKNNQDNQFVEQVVNSTGEQLFYLLFFFNKELSRFA